MITNRVLSKKEIVLVVHGTLVKPNVMREFDRMNIIIKLRAQNHQNTFEATSTTILHGLRNIKTRENLETSYIALWKLDRNEQKYFERLVLFGNDVT